MARYYFDLDNGSDIRDEMVREVDNPDTLRAEALRFATEQTAKDAKSTEDTALVLSVCDADGLTRLRVRLVCQVEDL